MANDLIVKVEERALKGGEFWWEKDSRDREFTVELKKEDDPILDGERGSIAWRRAEESFDLRWNVRWSILGRNGAQFISGAEELLLRQLLDLVFTRGFYDLQLKESKAGRRKAAAPA